MIDMQDFAVYLRRGNIQAWITPVMGSSVPYFAAGLIGVIGGIFFFVVGAMMTPAVINIDDDDDD